MNPEKIKLLIEELQKFSSIKTDLINSNYKRKEERVFRTYYRSLLLILIEYIKFRKNKAISEEAKTLQNADQIFKGARIWISLLGICIAFPGVLFVFLLGEGYNVILYTLGALDAIAIFLIIRAIQRQPAKLQAKLEKTGVTIKQLLYLIKQIEQSLPETNETKPNIVQPKS